MATKTPKDYRCLSCNAAPGSPCKRPSGHTIPGGDFHAGRKEMWRFFNSPGYGSSAKTLEEIDATEREASGATAGQEALF